MSQLSMYAPVEQATGATSTLTITNRVGSSSSRQVWSASSWPANGQTKSGSALNTTAMKMAP